MTQEVFRSAVGSGAGWNYCIKHFFKSRQSCDWSLSIQKVNWSRILTLCGKGIWVEGMLEPQNVLCTWEQGWAEQFIPSPAGATSQPWPALNSRGVWRAALISAWKTPHGKCKRGAKPKRMETVKQQHLFIFFPRNPINWNCWSLHGVIKMFYTLCFTAWLYFPLCCWYLLKSIPKCWLPLNFEAEKLQIHILIWFWGRLGS